MIILAKPHETYKDKQDNFYVILDSPVDVYHYLYVVNLTQLTVVRMKENETDNFIKNQDLIPTDLGVTEIDADKKVQVVRLEKMK